MQICIPHDMTLVDDIATAQSCRLLGTSFNSKLTFNIPVENVFKWLGKAFYVILQLRSSLDIAGLLNVYYSLAYSHISYNILCWRIKQLSRLFVVEKK